MTPTATLQEGTATLQRGQNLAGAQFARMVANSTASHPHLTALLAATGPSAARDLADAVHLLCHLHGSHPGLIDVALAACPAGPARVWLADVSVHYERERLYLVQLAAAVGRLPSTPGAALTESALQSQRRAIKTLARSERRGCALGAATALIADWVAIRSVLDRAAARAGVDSPSTSLPGEASIVRVLAAAVDTVSSERALGFGAEQLLLQHRALFDLLEARAVARVG